MATLKSRRHITPVRSSHRPLALWAIVAILTFIGLGALLPGYAMIADPTGVTLGMAGQLDTPLFTSFLVPGLFLFFVIGVGTITSALVLVMRPNLKWAQALNPVRTMHWHWLLALLMSAAVMIWIIVQVFTVRDFSWLQPLYFFLGVALVALLFIPAVRQHFTIAKHR